MVKRVEVLHGEFPLEGKYGVLQERCARCGEHNVINIKQQVYRISAAAKYEHGGVGLGLNKSQSKEVRGEPVVPSPGHLFQPVERLVEAVDPVRLHGINKPCRLATVDYLWESTMQEHVLHIKLVDRPGRWVKPRRTQRALYHSRVSSELNLCLKIHFLVTTLEPVEWGTRSQVLLVI
jgi:hypothetical protein